MKAKLLIAVMAAAGLVGCASKQDASAIAKQESKVQEMREDAAEKRTAKANEELERQLKKVPDWVMTPPRGDGAFVYAVGEGRSSSFDMARKKANLNAEFGLARQYKQALSGSERLYQRDSADAGKQERYTLLIDRLVDRVSLTGNEVVKSDTAVMGGEYTVWVLAKISFDEMHKTLAKQRSIGADKTIDLQFEELDRRLKAYREEQRSDSARVTSATKVEPQP